jgi:uncharacterized protein YxjI
MEIDVNQKKISIGDKYRIFIDGEEKYFASRQLFRLLAHVSLYETGTKLQKLSIKKRFSFFKAKYDITRFDYSRWQFRTKSFWKFHFECISGADVFEIYGHRGRKFSIFKNNEQIAWWNKQAVTWFAGDNYKIIANKDCDVELIIAFCLIIDNYLSDKHDGSTVTYDVGNIGFEARKFDPAWQPK